ncbi:MAG TPA: RsmE family RNA methyltransferase [Candidatus Limnocylindrales bacterium]|nr:RsmE family RNA methyltransferase [Candidatus Limnocylindrales bacterium]
MTLHRFFVAPEALDGNRFPLPPSIERQVRGVLRMTDGERLVLLPGDGSQALCRLDGADCVVEERSAVASEPRHRLTVVQALLKGDALEEVVQHATEIGVAAFQLIVTERCVAREISPRRLARLRAIAREAAEQSERGIVPPIAEPVSLRDTLAAGSVLLYERHDGTGLAALDPPPVVIIGAEGGFSPAEVDAAREAGATIGSLGPRILRSQTVAVAAAAVILSRTGDFA